MKAAIAESMMNKNEENRQIVQEMRTMMEGMRATEKENVTIKQQVIKMAEEVARMSERQDVTRVSMEAAMTKNLLS